MRAPVCAIVAAIALTAHPAFAQANRTAATFWKSVQATCDATAARPPSELGQRIAQTAIDEFAGFGGHQIDSNGRLFHFGLTEAEHEEDDGGSDQANLGHLGWWQVMKYWRVLFGDDPTDKLEVRGYRDASTSTQETQAAALLRTSAARLLREAERVSDPEEREILREAALRVAIVDTSWSAAFISYVVRQSGVSENMFRFANAHRADCDRRVRPVRRPSDRFQRSSFSLRPDRGGARGGRRWRPAIGHRPSGLVAGVEILAVAVW